ncbi:glycosyltransferase family 4 protein [Selenomonas ruminantium]|uniref:glycosyltransferase family 4 protein n=1 Tax=Selenomonas ruminantium TaxID=971 RepID=UPI0012FE91ED|nr:glycosyltransferase family 4 protein [Selenomonas ruminantium]
MKNKIVVLGQRGEPIPAVNGGAVSTLMQLLIEENEKEGFLDLIVISSYNYEAKIKSSKYKRTKFIYINEDSIILKIVFHLLRDLGKIIPKLRKCINTNYLWQAYCYLKKMKDIDWVVVEEGKQILGYWQFKQLPMKTAYHSHLYEIPDEFPLYDRIITVSSFCSKPWLRFFSSSQVKVCCNAIQEYFFSDSKNEKKRESLRRELGYTDNDILVLYIGRIKAIKGVRELSQAVLLSKDNRIKLLLIGSSEFAGSKITEYEEYIDKLAEESNGRIRHIGYLPNQEICNFSKISDIQCVPSMGEEAAGLVAIEAMAMGLPLIVTKSGGLVEYVSKECAVILERNDDIVNNIKNAIEDLADDTAKREKMGKVGKERAKQFTRKEFYRNFIKTLED